MLYVGIAKTGISGEKAYLSCFLRFRTLVHNTSCLHFSDNLLYVHLIYIRLLCQDDVGIEKIVTLIPLRKKLYPILYGSSVMVFHASVFCPSATSFAPLQTLDCPTNHFTILSLLKFLFCRSGVFRKYKPILVYS